MEKDRSAGCEGPVTEYPEHEKLKSIREESQAIGQFLDLSGYVLCEVGEGSWDRTFVPVTDSIQTILARYFDIDETALENEKRAMLEELRG